MSATYENVSADLIWEIVNGKGAQLVKTKMSGGQQFSRDPFNLLNKHSRKHEGFVNDKAISILPTEKGIKIATKSGKANKPAKATHTTTYSAATSGPKVYKSIVGSTAKRGYRGDLRQAAVARASAVKLSHKSKKERAAAKPRGKKSKVTAEEV